MKNKKLNGYPDFAAPRLAMPILHANPAVPLFQYKSANVFAKRLFAVATAKATKFWKAYNSTIFVHPRTSY